jgi:hypothetical protein
VTLCPNCAGDGAKTANLNQRGNILAVQGWTGLYHRYLTRADIVLAVRIGILFARRAEAEHRAAPIAAPRRPAIPADRQGRVRQPRGLAVSAFALRRRDIQWFSRPTQCGGDGRRNGFHPTITIRANRPRSGLRIRPHRVRCIERVALAERSVRHSAFCRGADRVHQDVQRDVQQLDAAERPRPRSTVQSSAGRRRFGRSASRRRWSCSVSATCARCVPCMSRPGAVSRRRPIFRPRSSRCAGCMHATEAMRRGGQKGDVEADCFTNIAWNHCRLEPNQACAAR